VARVELKETAAEFLNERRDFLYVYATPSVSGHGYDVVIRLDGTYSARRDAEDVAKFLRHERMEWITDFTSDGRDWWSGPPWLRKRKRSDHKHNEKEQSPWPSIGATDVQEGSS